MEIIKVGINSVIVDNSLTIDLSEKDIYSQNSFQDLQDQRFVEGTEFYICVVRELGRTYLFDASKFMENCIHHHGVIDNPFTRRSISDFEIYVSSEEHPDFQLYMDKKGVMTPPNHFPIYWSDTSLPETDRLCFMLRYAKHFESSDLPKALETYEKAAQAGSTAAKLRLAQLYSGRPDKSLAIKHLKECLKADDISTSNVFACARLFGKFQAPKLAFEAYVISAGRGNQYGLGGVIRHLEIGIGVDKSPSKAAEWRQKLPEAWRDASITDFFKHLKALQYSFDSTSYP